MAIFEHGIEPIESCPLPGEFVENGLFETFKCLKRREGWFVLALDRHLERLKRSSEQTGVILPHEDKIISGIVNACCEEKGEVLRVRVIVTGRTWYVVADKFYPRFKGESGAWLLPVYLTRERPEHKWLTSSLSVSSQVKAQDAGFDEALLVDSKGEIREGSWSNFYSVMRNGEVWTPKTSVLPGITRTMVHDILGEKLRFKDFTLESFMLEGEEAFITNALNGVVKVSRVGDKEFKYFKTTASLARAYEALFNENSSLLMRLSI